MKKFLTLLFAIIFSLTVFSFGVQAEWNPAKANNKSKNKTWVIDCNFYIQLYGCLGDENDNPYNKPVDLFTESVYKGHLYSASGDSHYRYDMETGQLVWDKNYSVSPAGFTNGYPKDLILALGDKNKITESTFYTYFIQDGPTDAQVFEVVQDRMKNTSYLKDSDKNIVPWNQLNADNYTVQWYILQWRQNDGFWHLDGRLVNKQTKRGIEIITPENPADIPPEAYGNVEEDTSIHLEDVRYAYIFGYEPIIKDDIAEIQMGMDDYVTVEQVSTMLMRLLDQATDTRDNVYAVTDLIAQYQGQWFERGLAYEVEMSGLEENDPLCGNITRGQVAKLVAAALKLNLTTETPFVDITDNIYADYIAKCYKYGYVKGISDTEFNPNAYMTRAELCSLINNIIGRNNFGLIAKDEAGNEFAIDAATYYIVDMNPNHWGYETVLKATSAYDENGYVNLALRFNNIRNKLDNYDSQIQY